MGLEDLTTLDATYPKGNIEPVSVLDNYQRETRAKLKAWAGVEHDLVTGHHVINTVPTYPVPGRMYYDKITSELRYYVNGPPGVNTWRSVIQPPFNYVFNPEFKLMADGSGPNSIPCGYGWSGGAGNSIYQDIYANPGRFGIVLGVTGGSGVYNSLAQSMSTSNPRFLPIDYWRGRTVSFGCYIISQLANKAYLQMGDGVQNIASNVQQAGGSGWEWCVATMTVGAGATDLVIGFICQPDSTTYITRFSMPTLVEGAWCPRPTPQAHPQRSHILTFNSLNGVINTMIGTYYYGPAGRSTNEFLVCAVIPYRYCARNLSVYCPNPVGTPHTVDFRIRYNNTTDSSIACQLAGAGVGSAVDNVHTLMGDANSTLSLRSVSTGTPNSNAVSASLYIDELPW